MPVRGRLRGQAATWGDYQTTSCPPHRRAQSNAQVNPRPPCRGQGQRSNFLTAALPPPSRVCAYQQQGPASTRSRIRTSPEAREAGICTCYWSAKFGKSILAACRDRSWFSLFARLSLLTAGAPEAGRRRGWGCSWLGWLGGVSGKAQLWWGEGRGRTAAALARRPARGRPARISLYLATSTARKPPFPFVSLVVRAEGVPWGARGPPSTSAARRGALVAVSASNDV